ncbi:MAG TPA: hypothetical protein VNJ70_07070 [Thermoanaerobaculia bacterium]|nr:hypothetical protein [Thermoanaerobaculia bacterium]
MPDRRKSTVPPIPIPERKPTPYRDLAQQLVQELTPEGERRISEARAEVHGILSALHIVTASVERLAARGKERERAPSLDIPQDIPKWRPGDSLNMPANLGGEYLETSPEAFFWCYLGLSDVREELEQIAAHLTGYLEDADPYNAVTRAEEVLPRLPEAMLKALRVRLAKLKARK